MLEILITILLGVFTNEISENLPRLAEKIIRWGVRLLPVGSRQRCGDEFLAELDCIPSKLCKVLKAFELVWVCVKAIQLFDQKHIIFYLKLTLCILYACVGIFGTGAILFKTTFDVLSILGIFAGDYGKIVVLTLSLLSFRVGIWIFEFLNKKFIKNRMLNFLHGQ
jgi:hypothetical protein